MCRQRSVALLTNGLSGLFDATPKSHSEGIWPLFHELNLRRELDRVKRNGSLHADRIFGLDDFAGTDRVSRDSQIGSIGGWKSLRRNSTDREDLRQHDRLRLGIESRHGDSHGPYGISLHRISLPGGYYRDVVREIYPPSLRHPKNGIFILPENSDKTGLFWDCMNNAANFAFANRFFLALMALAGLRDCIADAESQLLYDAPHNLVWKRRPITGPATSTERSDHGRAASKP